MEIQFGKKYLKDLYVRGDGGKKHRYQPEIIRRYIRTIDLMIEMPDVDGLKQYRSLHYEKLRGDKNGLSSVRVNNQYRIEFKEILRGQETVASICNVVELSNHYE